MITEHAPMLYQLFVQAPSCEAFVKTVRKHPEIQIGQAPLEWVWATLCLQYTDLSSPPLRVA